MALVAALAGLAGCRGDADIDAFVATRISPSSLSGGSKSGDAWGLFDRSIASTFSPSAEQVLDVTFDRVESLGAIKVFGPAPYRVHVYGPGGIAVDVPPLDLSRLARGWHTFPLSTSISTRSLLFRFERVASELTGGIPELELWSLDGDRTPGSADLLATDLRGGLVAFRAASPKDEIAPSACASFAVTLTRPASQLLRAHLVYDARGPLRPFALRRSINGSLEQGGTWISADDGVHTHSEEVDPAVLQQGPNEVRLCVPTEANQTVSIADLRIVGTLDRGSQARAVHMGVTATARDAATLLDGDTETRVEIAAREPVSIAFDRSIAPDAILLSDATESAPAVACVDGAGRTTSVPARLSSSGTAIALDGGTRACSSLAVTFDDALSLTTLEVVGSGAAFHGKCGPAFSRGEVPQEPDSVAPSRVLLGMHSG